VRSEAGFYSQAAMRRLIAPQSVAIVGASARPGSFGAEVRENCRRFDGRLYLVNPAYSVVGEERCYASLAELPETPDCVVVTVKRELVEDVISECVTLGVGAAIVFASGYAEVRDEARKAEQRRLADAARRGGLLLAGPNTNGSSNFVNGAVLTFSPEMALDAPTSNAVGVVSQSGAVGYAAGQAMRRGVNLSHVLVCGNSADVDVADYVAYLAKDDGCAAIVCMVEGLDDPARLVRAAELAREADKPLIMFKAGRGEVAAAATLSHTGSIAGSHQAYVAALENAGAIFVEDHEALLDTAAFLAKAPPPRSGGVAVATASGGWGVILAEPSAAARPRGGSAGGDRPGVRLSREPVRRHRPDPRQSRVLRRDRKRAPRRGLLRRAGLAAAVDDPAHRRGLREDVRDGRRRRPRPGQDRLHGLVHPVAGGPGRGLGRAQRCGGGVPLRPALFRRDHRLEAPGGGPGRAHRTTNRPAGGGAGGRDGARAARRFADSAHRRARGQADPGRLRRGRRRRARRGGSGRGGAGRA
jgi:succinyl-CoA synthetase alpha subunit